MHVAKFNAAQSGNMIAHMERKNYKDRDFGNKDIDKDRTPENYNLLPGRGHDYMQERINNLKHINRADVITMADWVVTLPKDYDGSDKDFFRAAARCLANRYGMDNVIGAYVHMDERTPHMHFAFVPATHDKEPRLCAKQVICRADLQTIHRDMERAISRDLGHDVHLLTEEKRTYDKTIEQLKSDTAVRTLEAIQRAEKMKDDIIPAREPKRGLRGKYVDYETYKKDIDTMSAKLYVTERQLSRARSDMQVERSARIGMEQRWHDSLNDYSRLRDEHMRQMDDRDYLRGRLKELEREDDRSHTHSHYSDHIHTRGNGHGR